MKIALYYRNIGEADRPAFDALCAALHNKNIETMTVGDGDSVDGCDFLFSIGGDGTLLSSVQLVHAGVESGQFPPVLGINFGHLGFLTTVGRDNLDGLADDLIAGRYSVEERTLLEVNPNSLALNEVFVHRGEAMSLLRTQVFVDGDYVATYAGDGVIVATPTGSTAYSLSCGGPILTPTSGCFLITPIAAHTLTLRPIIVPDTAHITLRTGDMPATLGIDSRRQAINGTTEMHIRRAPFSIRLIRTGTQNFFSAIRDKLMWGSEVRG